MTRALGRNDFISIFRIGSNEISVANLSGSTNECKASLLGLAFLFYD